MSVQVIAKRLGISTATVSRVINHHPMVSVQMRQKVEQAMQRMGYVPPDPSRRRGPRTGAHRGIRTRSIAVLFSEPKRPLGTSPLHATLLHGIESALSRQNLNLVLSQFTGLAELPPAIRRGTVDGVLFVGQFPSEPVAARLRRFACVWMLTRCDEEWWGDSVEPDNQAAGELAARYLVGRGHTRLAFLNLDPGLSPFVQRGEAFEKAARKAGATVDMLIGDGPQRAPAPLSYPEQVGASVDRLLSLSPRATGLFVPFDMLTDALYRALAPRGVRPGRDIEIVSCNNGWVGVDGLQPRPASVDLRIELIGRQAVEQLLWRMANPHAPSGMRILVPPVLLPAGKAQS